MRSSLVPCTVCRRHVHLADGVCPFCGGAVVATMVPASSTKLPSRAAMMALAATLVPACNSSDETPAGADTGADTGDAFVSIDAAYGGPSDTGTVDTGTVDTGTFFSVDAAYGGPPDSGSASDAADSD